MTTARERTLTMKLTRVLIFILGVASILTETPISDVLAIMSLWMWLYMPSLIAFELKMIDLFKSWRNK